MVVIDCVRETSVGSYVDGSIRTGYGCTNVSRSTADNAGGNTRDCLCITCIDIGIIGEDVTSGIGT